MPLDWESAGLADGLACYRRHEFFDAHEHWEGVWLRSVEPEKSFLQALIHVAAAFHHLERENAIGAERQLRRALRKLEPCPAEFGGVAVETLRQSVRLWLRALEQNGVPPTLPYPAIR